MKTFKNIIVAFAFAVAVFVPAVPAHAAGSASLTLGANGSALVGSTVGVSIYENGDAVNVVTARLAYDASRLQFAGVDASRSAFSSDASTGGGNGAVEVSRFVNGGATVSGSQLVAVVNFKVIGSNGGASVTTTSGSQIASNGTDIWNGALSGVTIGLSAPVAAPAPVATPKPVTSTAPTVPTTSTTEEVTPEATVAPVTTNTTAPKASTTNKSDSKVELSNASDNKSIALPIVLGILVILIGAATIAVLRRRTTLPAAKA